MKTKIYYLRKGLFSWIVTGLLVLTGLHAHAQCGTCTVMQQPCNGDGILLTTINTTAGLTPPLTFYYYDPYQTTHNSAGYSDTFTGEYTPYVYISDGYGNSCWLVTGMIAPFTINYPVTTPAVCPNPGSATITVNAGIMPSYVEWYDASSPFPGAYVGTGNPMSLSAGDYHMKVFYAGCYMFSDSTVYIQNVSSIHFSVTKTDANCNNGTASVINITGGTTPYSYLWSNGATSPTITGLHSGHYWVRVTDATGCYTEETVWIYQTIYIPVNFVVTQQPTCLDHNGKLMAFGSGGTSPYTYLWSNGQTTQEAINLPGGNTYSVVVTDANGCTGEGSKMLNSSTPIAVTYTATASLCTAATGTATLTISGGTPGYTIDWYTFPVQHSNPAVNLAPGTYSFKVTDAVGCIRTGSVIVPPQSTILASAYSTNAVCPGTTGTAGVNVTGSNPPFSFLWNTTQTTQTISPAAVGWHSCTITDNVGCSVTKSTNVYQISPVSVGISSTPANCIYAANGSLLAIPTGGTPPYTYYWSNGSTSNPAINLVPGSYYVTVTDGNGCATSRYCMVGNSATSDACYCTIDGYVYYDADGDCTKDPTETGIEHIMVQLSPFGYTWTDATGYYSFIVPTGNYTLSEVVQYIYPLTPPPCTANDPVLYSVIASSGCIYSHDFFNIINPLHDIHIVTTDLNYAIPGNPLYQRLIVQNDGTINELNILLDYDPEEQLSFWSSAPVTLSPITAPWFENTTSPIALSPGGSQDIMINYFTVPVGIPLGTLLNFEDIVAYAPPITNWLNDYTPWNNVNYYQTAVVGSYDPNFKEVTPKGTGTEGTISVNDSVLDYVIHFQNTGTYYAENVMVTDTLDPDLDWTSVRPGFSTHNYTADLSANGVLKFTFNNIHLDWKAQNEITSNGLVVYSIKQKPNLAVGSEIKNSAAIYFDYNAPVITNTTLNTIGFPAGTSGIKSESSMIVFPNPASDVLYVKMDKPGEIKSITIYDCTGRIVQTNTMSVNAAQKVAVGELATGIYFIDIMKVTGEKVTGKFVKN